jgi:hypothetical protein
VVSSCDSEHAQGRPVSASCFGNKVTHTVTSWANTSETEVWQLAGFYQLLQNNRIGAISTNDQDAPPFLTGHSSSYSSSVPEIM